MHVSRLPTILLLLLFQIFMFGQTDKGVYLENNGNALTGAYNFPKNIKVIGFGAYHGSAKTEDAELHLLTSLIKKNNLRYYFAETDISIAFYLNEYLKTGDEVLLNDLADTYGTRVPQERTIEVVTKWKKIKAMNDELPKSKKIQVLGADPIVTYKYTYRHLISLINKPHLWPTALQLQETVAKDTTDFSPYYNSYAKIQLKDFVSDYEADAVKYESYISNKPLFDYLIHTLKISFSDSYKREKEMYNNYLAVVRIFDCKDKTQYFRLGFSHLLKAKQPDEKSGSFFSMIIDSKMYSKNEMISITGYLTKSSVIWKDKYDKNGEYTHSTTNSDIGTGDSESEYFRGIDDFKAQQKGDLTIFNLNTPQSPYSEPGCTDMIEVVTKDKPVTPGDSATTDFIDYALLISNSPASRSIYSLKK
jgi:hypothetical protein